MVYRRHYGMYLHTPLDLEQQNRASPIIMDTFSDRCPPYCTLASILS